MGVQRAKPFAGSARVSLASFSFPSIQTCKEKTTMIVNYEQCQSIQEGKDGDNKAAIWSQWTYELKNYLRSRISQPRYSTGCRSNTSGTITVRSKPH